jgi:hypothetical protein
VERRQVALRVAGMTRESPPRWLERMLLLFLPARDRETISGDLLEEYREEQLPGSGSTRANLWYLRQSISFASVRMLGGPHMKQLLILMCLFVVAAGTWLGVMENVLKHPGYAGRSVIAACIALEGLITLLFLLVNGRPMFRVLVMTGAAAMVLLGASATVSILRAEHFEGFVLLIGLALILQGALTFGVLLRTHGGTTA